MCVCVCVWVWVWVWVGVGGCARASVYLRVGLCHSTQFVERSNPYCDSFRHEVCYIIRIS